MKGAKVFSFLIFALLIYQNCSPFAVDETWAIYSYRTPPQFFYDAKLLSVERDSLNRENYTIDFVVSYAKDPSAEVEYRVAFSTSQMPAICPIRTGKAKGATRHFRMSCLLPHADDLYIQLTLMGPGGEELVRQIAF